MYPEVWTPTPGEEVAIVTFTSNTGAMAMKRTTIATVKDGIATTQTGTEFNIQEPSDAYVYMPPGGWSRYITRTLLPADR